jgi:hypothetical protein
LPLGLLAGGFLMPEETTMGSKYNKAIAALLAAAGVFASSGLLAGTAELVLNTVIAAAGAALVLFVPNAAEPAPTAQPLP